MAVNWHNIDPGDPYADITDPDIYTYSVPHTAFKRLREIQTVVVFILQVLRRVELHQLANFHVKTPTLSRWPWRA